MQEWSALSIYLGLDQITLNLILLVPRMLGASYDTLSVSSSLIFFPVTINYYLLSI